MKRLYRLPNLLIITLISSITLLLGSCGLNKKAQLDALAKSSYSIESIDGLRIADIPVESILSDGEINSRYLPKLGLAVLKKDLPIKGALNLKISNSTFKSVRINQFKYLIEIQGKELFQGTVDQNIALEPNASTIVPMSFLTNLFDVSEKSSLDKILADIMGSNKTVPLTLKIKPSFRLGRKNIYFPSYISINKDLSKSMLFR